MKILYVANDIIEAQLLNLVLRTEGLSSFVKNASLQSGIGELPFVETWPEVWINDLCEWDTALGILVDFEQAVGKKDWVCSNCNEINPGSFQICWSCDFV